MLPIIELLFDEKVSVDQLFAWINGEKNAELEALDRFKLSFVPSFLNYLRDQTCSFLHYSGHSSLTPGKATPSIKSTKYISSKTRDPSINNAKGSSKTRLDFSDSFVSIFESKTSISQKNEGQDNPTASKTTTALSPKNLSELNAFNDLSLPSFRSQDNERTQSEFSSVAQNICPVTKPHGVLGPSVSSPYGYTSILTPKHKKFSPIDSSTPGRRSPSPRMDYARDPKGRRRTMDEPSFEGRLSNQKVSLAEFIVDRKKVKKKGSQRNISPEKISEENPFVLDLEAFPPMGSVPSKPQQPKKRINPTLVSTSHSATGSSDKPPMGSSHSFGRNKTQAPHSAFLSSRELDPNAVSEERQLMKNEIKRISNKENTFSAPKGEPPPFSFAQRDQKSQNCCDLVTPHPNKVSNKRELDFLSQIHSKLILYNMVPNIMVEFYYLFQLLTINSSEYRTHDESDCSSYFTTVHNCVYFSVSSLSCIVCCLSHLDKSTLKLLGANSRIQCFSPALHTRLADLCEVPRYSRPRAPPKSPILSVSFQSETDNRNNFPTTVAFQIFKKQRDLFYEIIRIWEKNHLDPDWVFQHRLSTKISLLMNMMEDSSINLMHFARLFHFQLIAMCKGNEELQTQSDMDDLCVLMQLKRERPEKYQLLFERLVRPFKFGGPVPSPSFSGAQEFFHDFLVTASNPRFVFLLRDIFVFRILQLNDLSLQIVENEEWENVEFVKNEFCSSLESLRLLGKFLGFLEFMPYQTKGHIPEGIIANQILIRSQVSPSLPLMEVLKNAVKSRSLVVAIPWVVEYLSMVDSLALHTRYYLTVVFVLIFINKILYTFQLDLQLRVCDKCPTSNGPPVINPLNSFYLKTLLGWLFSLPNFPEGLFYSLEEEADIDQPLYEEVRRSICNSYTNLCFDCLRIQTSHRRTWMDISNGSSSNSDVFSPIKCSEDFSYISPKKAVNRTPSKFSGAADLSPIKTPSKLLQVSMIDTPDGTPLKPINEQSLEDQLNHLHIDTMPIVDHQILLSCCPYLGELKSMLSEFAFGVSRNRANNIRKITPLTSCADGTSEQPERSLQLQLEDNFFHNKPSSTKKIVEFVAERIYSNVLRYLRADLILRLKEKYLQQLKQFILNASETHLNDKLTEMVEKKTHGMSQDLIAEVKDGALKEVKRLSGTKELQSSLSFLLPMEVTKASEDVCCKIVQRVSHERVVAWLNSQLTAGFCTKELLLDANKFIKSNNKTLTLPSSTLDNSHSTCNNSLSHAATSQMAATLDEQGAEGAVAPTLPSAKKPQDVLPIVATVHDSSLPSPSTLLSEIKTNLHCLMVTKSDVSPQLGQEEMLSKLKTIRAVVLRRKDMRPIMYKAFSTLTTDWIVAYAVCVPETMTKAVVRRVMDLWMPIDKGGIFSCPDSPSCFLSARTIMLLGQEAADRQTLAWQKIEFFLTEMIVKHKMISPCALQESCVALLRYSWPQEILKGISRMVNSIFGRLKRHPNFKDDPETVGLLDWVSWVCEEMES